MSSTHGFAQKIWLVAALANAGCASPPQTTPATPGAFTCPTFPTSCESYDLHETISSDPIEPFEPTCPAMGEFRNQLDFRFCRCDHEQYVEQLSDWAACISKRRAQLATAVYNEMVRVYNCRLSQDGCAAASSIRSMPISSIFRPYLDRMPTLPACTTYLAQRSFHDVSDAQSCRFEVEDLSDDLTRWAERTAAAAESDAHLKADQAISRFNCHAQGGRYC
jgi:hypothetical protein